VCRAKGKIGCKIRRFPCLHPRFELSPFSLLPFHLSFHSFVGSLARSLLVSRSNSGMSATHSSEAGSVSKSSTDGRTKVRRLGLVSEEKALLLFRVLGTFILG